jgi:drug/metabolite transporter (DMT)-like permease
MPQITIWQLGILLLLSIVFIASKYATLKAVNLGDISVVMPIVNSWGAPSVILSALLLNETIPQVAIPLIALILFGVALVSIQRLDKLRMSKEAPLAILGMAAAALSFTGIVYFAKELGPVYPALILEAFMLVWLVGLHTTTKHKLHIVPKHFAAICASSLLFAVGTVTYASSASFGVAFIAIPLAAASPLVVLVIARIFFKERLLWHQLAGAALALIGIIALALV